ncbi:hypothetical protein CJJ23_02655 [Mycoplasmopsis agassizii]|uniref:Formate transporter n=1 Tax=Mycoplasmopsis agassizii TaxID=33922 RepID=A0A269TIK6_9BACT|nr:formate/nitrite transporter family protein [Mycoplasmopsis agassizii]PAK21313.1 hypothetical protein CJJ23_02655 [Mycoplasmopsis agassizii]
MHNYKDNFDNALNYSTAKATMVWWRIVIMGILGTVYMGLAYVGYIKVAAQFLTPESIALAASAGAAKQIAFEPGGILLASFMLPIGVVLIVFLGGSLFASDSINMIAVFSQVIKVRTMFRKWLIVLTANVMGGFLIAFVMWWGNVFNARDIKVIAFIVEAKTETEWWMVIGNSFAANIIVAGMIWASLATSNPVGKIAIIMLPFGLFVLTGFNLVVSNAIVFAFAILSNDRVAPWLTEPGEWIGRAIYINFFPSALGNWLSGALFLPGLYYLLIKFKVKPGSRLLNLGIFKMAEEGTKIESSEKTFFYTPFDATCKFNTESTFNPFRTAYRKIKRKMFPNQTEHNHASHKNHKH